MSMPMNVATRPEPTRARSPEERAAGLEESWFRRAHRAAARNPDAPAEQPAPMFDDALADAWFR
jgi:hypothetical protein